MQNLFISLFLKSKTEKKLKNSSSFTPKGNTNFAHFGGQKIIINQTEFQIFFFWQFFFAVNEGSCKFSKKILIFKVSVIKNENFAGRARKKR